MGSHAAPQGEPVQDDYANPLEQSPRWLLSAQAYALRCGASLGFSISHTWAPPEIVPSKVLWLDALLGQWTAKNAIRVDVWVPPPREQTSHGGSSTSEPALSAASEPLAPVASDPDDTVDMEDRASIASKDSIGSTSSAKKRPKILSRASIRSMASIRSRSSFKSKSSSAIPSSQSTTATLRPAIINFHGGGFILGDGTDDSRWCSAAASALDAVVFSVSYRLAPGYPFPTAVEDCVSAIVQLCGPAMAVQNGIDTSRVVLSGFSAGGNLGLASWVVLQEPDRWGYDDILSAVVRPGIAGLALFYPLLDWTARRDAKRAASARPDLTLPKGLTDLFDASYIYPPMASAARGDPRLSPGLMVDELLGRLPPVHLCLCEFDMLLAEGLVFAERVRGRGRQVEARVVKGEKHGWDKTPWAPKENAADEYEATIASIKGWLGLS